MIQEPKARVFDLEERTFKFAKRVRELARVLPKSTANIEDAKQLIRSSGSVGANYIEASEALSKKDFILRIKISLKETKESKHWLRLLDIQTEATIKEQANLIQEANELANIFGSIVKKVQL